MRKTLSLTIVIALSTCVIAKASPFTITSEVGGVPIVGSATLENFNGAAPSILSLSGSASILTGGDWGVAYVPPYFSGSTAAYFGESPATGLDDTQYIAIRDGGTATFSFATPETYFGLCWGSFDEVNSLAFYDSANNLIGSFTGGDVPGALLHDTGLDGTRYVNIISSTPFTKVVAASSGNSFEFDDVAYALTVPEPASGLLLSIGILAFGFVKRSKLS